MEDKKIPLFAYYLKAGKHKAAWEMATSLAEIERRAADMRVCDPATEKTQQWEIGEVIEIALPSHHAKAIGGYLCGSHTSDKKKAAARRNGNNPTKEGGRPRGRPVGTGKLQKAAVAAMQQAVVDTIPLIPEAIKPDVGLSNPVVSDAPDAFDLVPEPVGKPKVGKK